jgi:hypothetical protein
LVKNIELGKIEAVVAVDQVGVPDNDEVEPAAAPPASSCNSIFTTNLLQVNTDVLHKLSIRIQRRISFCVNAYVQLFGGEGPSTNASGICFDDTNGVSDQLRGNTQPSAHSANGSRGRRNKGISPKVNIEHEGVGAFHQNLLARGNGLVDIREAVDHIGTESLRELLVSQDLAFGVVVKVTVALETAFDELPELGREGVVEEVVDAQARSRGLARVRRTNAPLGGADANQTGMRLPAGYGER